MQMQKLNKKKREREKGSNIFFIYKNISILDSILTSVKRILSQREDMSKRKIGTNSKRKYKNITAERTVMV